MSSTDKHGLDKEIQEQRNAKYDTNAEMDAVRWIENITGVDFGIDYDRNDVNSTNLFFRALKNGVILCKLANCIKPGIILNYDDNPKHWLEEKANINKYIEACIQLGVPSQDLVTELDFSESKKDPSTILQNIYAVGRQAQAIGYPGPRLGVRYYRSREDQIKLERRKTEEKAKEQEVHKMRRETAERRRTELEAEDETNLKDEMNHEERKRVQRRKTRESTGRSKSLSPFGERIAPTVRSTPLLYGMDRELQQKRKDKYDESLETAVMNWLEDLTSEEIDDLWLGLKSGRILCMAANKIHPNIIPKINEPGHPYRERVNIQLFLNACVKLGVPQVSLFNINDLYERTNLNSVLMCLTALSRKLEERPSYKGCLVSHYLNPSSPRPVLVVSDEETPSQPSLPPPLPPPPKPVIPPILSSKRIDEFSVGFEPPRIADLDIQDKKQEEVMEDEPVKDVSESESTESNATSESTEKEEDKEVELEEEESSSSGIDPKDEEQQQEEDEDIFEQNKPKKKPNQLPEKKEEPSFWEKVSIKGRISLVLYLLVIFLVGGGNFGDFWFRTYLIQNTSMFIDDCMNSTEYCRYGKFERMSSIVTAVSFWTFTIAAVLLEIIGPKMTSWIGIFFKILACLLFAIGDPYTCNTCYVGYFFFSTSSPFILISSISVFVYFSKLTFIITTLVSVYFAGGGWVFYILFIVIESFSWRIAFFTYSGIFGAILILTVFLWPVSKLNKSPKKGQEPVLIKTRVQFNRRFFKRLLKAFKRWHYLYLLIFLTVVAIKSNLLLVSIRQQLEFLSSDYDLIQDYNKVGTFVLSTLSLLPILLSFLGDKFHPQLNLAVILFFATLNSAMGLVAVSSLQVIRYVATGVYYPFSIGYAIAYVIKGKGTVMYSTGGWEYFGFIFGALMMICGIFVFALVRITLGLEGGWNVLFAVNVFFCVLSVLLFLYPLWFTLKRQVRKRKKMQRF